jgi:hypothetical protein
MNFSLPTDPAPFVVPAQEASISVAIGSATLKLYGPPQGISVKKIRLPGVKNPGCLSVASSWILAGKPDF